MHRRQLLQLLGSGLAMLPLSGLARSAVDPLRSRFERFAAARQRHPLLAGWVSISPPGTGRVSCKLRGRWPTELQGSLYRNGPGLFERDRQRYQHWFDGDGLVQHWQIADGRVSHQSRFVQTAKFVEEQRRSRFVRAAAGTHIPDAEAITGPDDINTANTAMLQAGGKLYALWEAGSAYELDPDTLATRGPQTWSEDLEGAPFSAHPLRDADGTLWNFGLFGQQLIVYRIGVDGVLLSADVLQLPRSGYLHSFVQTASRLVFALAPLLQESFEGSFFESLRWRPRLGSLLVIVDKAAPGAAPRLVECEAGLAYHYADAWDQPAGGIALRACWYQEGGVASSPFAHLMDGRYEARSVLPSELVRIEVPASGSAARLLRSGIADVEFPVSAVPAARSDLLLVQNARADRHGFSDSLVLLHADESRLQRYGRGSNLVFEEHLLVAGGGRRYALGTVLDTRKPATGLLLFETSRIEQGPIAEAWLEQAMPLGFHGAWIGT